MTTMSRRANEPERPSSRRTFAMVVVGASCWVLAAGVAYFLGYVVAVYAPSFGDESFVAEVAPIFSAIIGILGAVGTLSLFWRGARRRAWFWWLPVALAVLLLAQNAQDIPYDLARPANTSPFVITVVVLAGALGAIAGGVVAFFEVRRGRTLWTRSGRAAWSSIAVIGWLVGAAVTSLLAGLSSAGGPSVSAAPTVTAFVTLKDTTFLPPIFRMKRDDVLGLVINNPTQIGHSFDIDSLNIHVLLSPMSTTAVAIRPSGPGALDFYCSYHGHRIRGMAGVITVD